MDTTKPQEVPLPPPPVPKPNEYTSDAKFDFDIDGCNISEVIMFLQKLARSPDASDMHVAFTKHITDALVKIKEEKLKHKDSTPSKVEDSWEPIINMQVNGFDLKASCDLGSSVSIMPRKIYEMLDLPPLEDCYLDVALNMIRRNSWGVLMMFSFWLTMLMSLLISMFWMLNTMLLILLLWEDLFLEQLVPSLI